MTHCGMSCRPTTNRTSRHWRNLAKNFWGLEQTRPWVLGNLGICQVIKTVKNILHQSLLYSHPFPPTLTPILYFPLFNAVAKTICRYIKHFVGPYSLPSHPAPKITPVLYVIFLLPNMTSSKLDLQKRKSMHQFRIMPEIPCVVFMFECWQYLLKYLSYFYVVINERKICKLLCLDKGTGY